MPADSSDNGTIKSFRLLLPTSHDIRIIKKPSWLTPQHLLISLAIVFVVLVVAIGWTLMVAKKNLVLKSLVQEKETAQHELQQAHDELEERVRERTAQLKIEMTCGQANLSFNSVRSRRKVMRLAQEFARYRGADHDRHRLAAGHQWPANSKILKTPRTI